jgi:hypothetical protein
LSSGRVNTIRALIVSSSLPAAQRGRLIAEFEAIDSCRRIGHAPRRHLLQVLHACRGVDSALADLVQSRPADRPQSIGSALRRLANPGLRLRLSVSRRDRYQTSVADIRNAFLHEADKYPRSDREVRQLLDDVYECLVDCFALA